MAMQNHVVAFSYDSLDMDSLPGILARHALEVRDERLLSIANVRTALDVAVAGVSARSPPSADTRRTSAGRTLQRSACFPLACRDSSAHPRAGTPPRGVRWYSSRTTRGISSAPLGPPNTGVRLRSSNRARPRQLQLLLGPLRVSEVRLATPACKTVSSGPRVDFWPNSRASMPSTALRAIRARSTTGRRRNRSARPTTASPTPVATESTIAATVTWLAVTLARANPPTAGRRSAWNRGLIA